jgi:hypothetical protein
MARDKLFAEAIIRKEEERNVFEMKLNILIIIHE